MNKDKIGHILKHKFLGHTFIYLCDDVSMLNVFFEVERDVLSLVKSKVTNNDERGGDISGSDR